MKNLEISVGMHRVRKGKNQSTSMDIDRGVFDLPVHANQNVPGRLVRCTAMQGAYWECVRITLISRTWTNKRMMAKPRVDEIQRVRDLFFAKDELVIQFYRHREKDDWGEKHLVVLWHPLDPVGIHPQTNLPVMGPNFTLVEPTPTQP